MKKLILPTIVSLLLLTVISVNAQNQVNVSFWQDLDMTTPYVNEFMYVYLRHKVCQSYELGGLNCTYDCLHGRYASGTAIINDIPSGLVWDFLIIQPASFDNDTSCPRVTDPLIHHQFDQKIVSSNLSLDYYLNETEIVTEDQFTFNFSTYLNVGYWVLTLIVVVVAGYYSGNGWIGLIVFVVMVIIKLLLFS